MQKYFIDEKMFKRVELEVQENDVQNYSQWNKRHVEDDWEAIRM